MENSTSVSVTGSASCERESGVPELEVLLVNDWMFSGSVWGNDCACGVKMFLNHSLTTLCVLAGMLL